MLSEHFSKAELSCKCGCGVCDVKQDLIVGLEEIRRYIKQPIIVTSGYRCPGADKACGGSGSGPHTFGMAADIYCPGLPMAELYRAIETCQGGVFSGLGAYPDDGVGFIHVDVYRARFHRWVRVKGKYIYLFTKGQV